MAAAPRFLAALLALSPLQLGFGVAGLALAIWGARLTLLEGLVYPWGQQGFRGDFYAVMAKGSPWWDGTGILYGPVFVIEKWLFDTMPPEAAIRMFGVSGIFMLALALGCCILAARARPVEAVVALGLALSFRFTYYALSVAASPELVELALLSLAWYAASRGQRSMAWVSVTVATLTKVIPVVFGPLLLARPSMRGFLVSLAAAAGLLAIVGIGQRMGPVEVLYATLVPSLNTPDGVVRQSDFVRPVPSSMQFLGLSSAIARVIQAGEGDASLAWVQSLSNGVTVLLAAFAVLVAVLLLRTTRVEAQASVTLGYGLLFVLMPLATIQPHPHTFVFLVPAWIAVVSLVARDADRLRGTLLGVFAATVYVPFGLPALLDVPDRLLRMSLSQSALVTDPIWMNLALICGLLVYASARLVRPDSHPNKRLGDWADPPKTVRS